MTLAREWDHRAVIGQTAPHEAQQLVHQDASAAQLAARSECSLLRAWGRLARRAAVILSSALSLRSRASALLPRAPPPPLVSLHLEPRHSFPPRKGPNSTQISFHHLPLRPLPGSRAELLSARLDLLSIIARVVERIQPVVRPRGQLLGTEVAHEVRLHLPAVDRLLVFLVALEQENVDRLEVIHMPVTLKLGSDLGADC